MRRLLTPTCGAASQTPPLSGFFICFIISSASVRYFLSSVDWIGSETVLSIEFVSHVCILRRAIGANFKWIVKQLYRLELNSSVFLVKFKPCLIFYGNSFHWIAHCEWPITTYALLLLSCFPETQPKRCSSYEWRERNERQQHAIL